MAVYLGSEMVNAFSGIPQSLNGENKTAITTALTNKGVAVPDDMGINDIAALIEAIEAGGSKFVSGSFTPNENVSKFTINHELGEIPNIYVVYTYDVDGSQTKITNKNLILICTDITDVDTYFGYVTRVAAESTYETTNKTSNGKTNITAFYANTNGVLISEADETKCMLTNATGSTTQYYFYAGFEYKFLIGRYDFV